MATTPTPAQAGETTRSQTGSAKGVARGLTWRSAFVGLVGVAALCAVTPYNDYHLHQTLLYGNHFPIGCLFMFTFFVLVVNTAIRRFSPGRAFGQQELLVVWAMLVSGGGLASSGLMRYLAPMVVGPFYYSTDANAWTSWSRYMPGWMVPSRDPNSAVVKGFFEGVPTGHRVPWEAWIHVFVAWGLLFACVVGLVMCLSMLLRKQWVERERLSFPLVHIPIEMTREPTKGLLNGFFSSRAMWLGCAVAIVIHTINGLHAYFLWIPTITLNWPIGQWFPSPPMNALGIYALPIYFSVIGIAFLLPTEVSFSLWAFFIAFRLLRVARVAVGLPALAPVAVNHEVGWSTGAFIAWTAWMLWGARAHLAAIFKPKPGQGDISAGEPIDLRTAAFGAVICFAGVVLWSVAAGMSPIFAVMMWACFALIMIVITRAVAESGLLFVQSSFFPTDLLSAIPGAKLFNAAGLGSAMVIQTAIIHDPREALMPSVMNSLKLKGEGAGRDMVIAILLAVAVGYAVSFVSFVGTAYRYGAVTMDPYGCRDAPRWFFGQVNQYILNPTGFDWAALVNLATGIALTTMMLFMRSKAVPWVPHPIGFMLPVTYAITMTWFSIFIAWTLKSLVLRFGGLRLMRIVLPFFLGLVVGEGIIAAVWVIVGMITGVGAPVFLPQ